MTRTMKLLTATTAFVAATVASANAAVITANQTGTIYTSATTGPTQISGTGVIVSSTDAVSASIEVSSSTASHNIIEVGTGTTLKNSGTSATIYAVGNSNAAVNIGVSGTVSALGGSKAIDLSNMTTNGSTLTVNGGTISGSVTLTGAVDAMTVSNSTLVGNVDLGAGNDGLTIKKGSSISGTIDGGANTDTLTFDMADGSYTTKGNLANFETVNVTSGTVNLNNAFTGTSPALAIANGGTVNNGVTNPNVGALTIANGGTLNLGTSTMTATGMTLSAGSKLGVTISDSTTAGKLVTGGSINSIANASLTVAFGATSGYIANGTSYTILSGASGTAGITPTLLTTGSGLYSFTVSGSGVSGVSLTVNRQATGNLATSDAAKAVAGLIDTVSSSATGELKTINAVLNNQSSAAGVDDVLESLTPANETGAAITTIDVGTSVGSNVSSRLASIRSASGVTTGDYEATGHMWVNGFGAINSQDDDKGNAGYDANTAGASFGVDTDTLLNGSTVGAAFSYAHSNVDSNASNNATTDIDSYIGTLYGSHVYDSGMFLNGQATVGFNSNTTERQVIGFGAKTEGDYDSMQYGLKAEAGRDLAYGSMTVTPLASLQYTYLSSDAYTETGPAALKVDNDNFNTLDAGIGADVAWNMPLNNGSTLRPNLRAKYIYRMGDTQGETTSRFIAGGPAFNTKGVEASRSAVNLGGGIVLANSNSTQLSLDYDADLRSSYVGQTGQIKLRWAF